MARRSPSPIADPKHYKYRSGFSLIELLTVIAVLAILAAVAFPAATSMRLHAQQRQVMSNMRALYAALLLYKQDERAWPPTLGSVTYYTPNYKESTRYDGLYPEWIRDRGVYESPANDLEDVNRLYGTRCDIAADRRWIVPYDRYSFERPEPARRGGATMYGWNTMDGHVEETYEGLRYIPHYYRWRTYSPFDRDYKRQLSYRTPPDDTVVTWNDTFVQKDPETGDYLRGDILVLFLDGTVKMFDVRSKTVQRVKGQYWRLKPS